MKCQSIGTNFQTRTMLSNVVEVSRQTQSRSLSVSPSLRLHPPASRLCLTRWWWSRRTWCVFDSCACPTCPTRSTWSTMPCLSAVTWSATSKWRAPRPQRRQSWPMRSQVRRSSRDIWWWRQCDHDDQHSPPSHEHVVCTTFFWGGDKLLHVL